MGAFMLVLPFSVSLFQNKLQVHFLRWVFVFYLLRFLYPCSSVCRVLFVYLSFQPIIYFPEQFRKRHSVHLQVNKGEKIEFIGEHF